MIPTAEELIIDLDNKEESKNFKLATVIELFENDTAKIKFDGEDALSEKQYAYLTSYTPKINDRVLLCSVGGTYIILGKVSYNVEPSNQTTDEINAIKSDITTINNNINTINSDITTINNNINTINSDMGTINNTLSYKISSNMTTDNGGNMNINYMYVDPSTGDLQVRRKNGLWTTYAKK